MVLHPYIICVDNYIVYVFDNISKRKTLNGF